MRGSIARLVLCALAAAGWPSLVQAQQAEAYAYDALGRLSSSTVSSGSSVAYQTNAAYDNAGNRTCYATSTGSTNTQCAQNASSNSTLITTLNAGVYSSCPGNNMPCHTLTGYLSAISIGSMTSTSYLGGTIVILDNSNAGSIIFSVSGASNAPTNSGWTQITIPGVGTLQRSAATYYTNGTAAIWNWSNTGQITSGIVTIQ